MHYHMIGYIKETPDRFAETLAENDKRVSELAAEFAASPPDKIVVTGIGSGYTAGLCARFALENLTTIPLYVVPASAIPFYEPTWLTKRSVVIAASRSGEKGYVLKAARLAKQCGARLIAITSTLDSLLAQEADLILPTKEGPEITWPKTKSTVCMAAPLLQLAVSLSNDEKRRYQLQAELSTLPSHMATILDQTEADMVALAEQLFQAKFQHLFLLGSGSNVGALIEIALKLKETCYLHAEAEELGQFVHGPMGLLGPEHAIINVLSPADQSSLPQVAEAFASMGSDLTYLTTGDGYSGLQGRVISLPGEDHPLFNSVLTILPLQYLTYYLGVRMGLNVDFPKDIDKVSKIILEPGRFEPEMRPDRI